MTYPASLHTRARSCVARSIALLALVTLGSGATFALPLAPVGHRQPTAADIRGSDLGLRTSAAARAHRSDRDLFEGTLRICSNCDL